MSACPACQTMLTRPGVPHRDITGTPCPGMPLQPVCGRCGIPVGLNNEQRAGTHFRDGNLCHGSDRRITTAELWAARPENLEREEQAA